MSSRTSSSSVSYIPLERCFENLRQSILQVVHHEHVSDEVRSFLAELVEALLHRAVQIEDSSSGTSSGPGGVRPTSSEIAYWPQNQAVDDPIKDHSIPLDLLEAVPYQFEIKGRSRWSTLKQGRS